MKKGQSIFGMSFGVIFSLILIVCIIVVGVIVVIKFLDVRDCGQIKLFIDDFQDSVNSAWRSEELSKSFEGRLNNIEYVCFIDLEKDLNGRFVEMGREMSDYSDENMFLYPMKNACVPNHRIEHLDISEITFQDNPYCVNVDGEIVINIEKEMGESLVKIY